MQASKKKEQQWNQSNPYSSRPAGQGSSHRAVPYYRTPSQKMPMLLRMALGPGSRILGLCIACNEYGHLRSNCPKLAAGRGSMHPCPSNTNVDSDIVSEEGCVYDSGAVTLVDNTHVDNVNTEHTIN